MTISRPASEYQTYDLTYKAGSASASARLEISAAGNGALVIGTVSLMPADNVDGHARATRSRCSSSSTPPSTAGRAATSSAATTGATASATATAGPPRTNPAWTGVEHNDFGMDEFIAFCREIGTEPMIAVNTGFGDAYSAAAEVEYANGADRHAHGRAGGPRTASREPFGVKYWCVGNEMCGNWQLGYMQLEHYVLKHNWVEDKMRQVDPTIKTIASRRTSAQLERGHAQELRRPHGPDQRAFLLPGAARPRRRTCRQIPDNDPRKADAHRQAPRGTDPRLKGKDIRIAMDEWNYWYGPHVFGELGTRYFLKDALGIAAGPARVLPQQRHHLHGQLRPDGQRDRLHQDHQDGRRF